MAADYMRIYQKILRRHSALARQLSTLAARSAALDGHRLEVPSAEARRGQLGKQPIRSVYKRIASSRIALWGIQK
jgi:hypothetical protein